MLKVALKVTSFFVLVIGIILPWIDRSSYHQVNEAGVVVISGATSGLGKDAALHFAKNGYYVLAGARSESKANALQNEALTILGDGARKFHAFVLDVSDASHHKLAAEKVYKITQSTSLPFTGLINNAGVSPQQLTDGDINVDIWRKLYEVNVFAPVSLVQEFDSLLKEHKGRIVNIGSVAGELCIPGPGAYCSSKVALKALTDSMRMKYSRYGVSVSLVSPGYVRSNMCDPAKFNDCGLLGPESTTTPAYFDAMTNPYPKTKYLVAHIGGGFHAKWTQLFHFIPARINDIILRKIVN